MKRSTKNAGNRIPRWELATSTKTKILEKNPTKGGTPAKDKIDRDRIFVKI